MPRASKDGRNFDHSELLSVEGNLKGEENTFSFSPSFWKQDQSFAATSTITED